MQSSGTHHYIELAIAIPPRLFESCIAMLSLEGIGYFLEEEERLLAYIPESEWNAEKETSIRSLLENTFGSIPPSAKDRKSVV